MYYSVVIFQCFLYSIIFIERNVKTKTKTKTKKTKKDGLKSTFKVIYVCKKIRVIPFKGYLKWFQNLKRKRKSRERTKKRDDKNKENYLLVHN